MFTKKRDAVFGRYPCCDLVNNAIRHILHGDNESAIEELLQAIWKADGYVHEDLKDDVQKIHECVWKKRKQYKENFRTQKRRHGCQHLT